MEQNIAKYQAFIETARQGSFTRAARRLAYSQSGVSRMVNDLEQEWGIRLLERGKHGARLTPDGQRILPRIEQICSDQRLLQAEVDNITGMLTGSIRIGTFSSVATHWLPRAIKRFRDDYPGIDYELLMGDYAEIEAWVDEGRVDIGFLAYSPQKPSLTFEPIGTDELMAVLPEKHRLAHKSTVNIADLTREPFLLLERKGVDEITPLFLKAQIELRAALSTWDDYTIMSMVESGLGLSILPALILKRNPYRLAIRPLAERAYRTIGLVHRGQDNLSVAALRFCDYLRRTPQARHC